MAERRMISLKIVDTDKFLEMPATTRLLYYDFCLRADDDGFIASPQKIIKMIGANTDDLRVLISKKYVLAFPSGICVIKDWRIHNYIAKDRYKPTIHQQEKATLRIDKTNAYIDCSQDNGHLYTNCIQNVYAGENRRDKDRISKNKREKGKQKLSLSQQKFLDVFPDKVIDCEFDDNKYDIDQLIAKIKDSEFLTNAKNITLKSCLKLYDKIMADYYKNYKPNKQAEPVQEIIEKDGKKFDRWGNELL